MIRISAVNYLNATPFIYGINNSVYLKNHKIEVSLDIPSICAKKLINGDVDIGLIPIATIPDVSNGSIISKYCIGANGKVGSVLLLSEVPLENITKIHLDYQSRTSVSLIKIIYNKWLKYDPLWIESEPGYEKQIKGTTGGIVIGDRALQIKDNYKFSYDLSELWKQYTNLPFVFACWITRIPLGKPFMQDFESALQWGLKNKQHIKHQIGYPLDIESYLSKFIKYELNEDKKKAMELFFDLSGDIN